MTRSLSEITSFNGVYADMALTATESILLLCTCHYRRLPSKK